MPYKFLPMHELRNLEECPIENPQAIQRFMGIKAMALVRHAMEQHLAVKDQVYGHEFRKTNHEAMDDREYFWEVFDQRIRHFKDPDTGDQ